MSGPMNFDDRLGLIYRHGRLLWWLVEQESKGTNPTEAHLLNHIETLDDGIDGSRIFAKLEKSGILIVKENRVRLTVAVRKFIEWARDASSILPASRIEQMLKEVIDWITEAYNYLHSENQSERERFAHTEDRMEKAEDTLSDLWGISEENLRAVVLASSKLRLMKDENPITFIVQVSKIWEKDIDPMSDFRHAASELSQQRRGAKQLLYNIEDSSRANYSVRKFASALVQTLDDTWDHLSYNHDLMQGEMRPLYDMVQRMRGTERIIHGAEAVVDRLNRGVDLGVNDNLRICSIRPRDLFSDSSVEAFLMNLWNIEEETDLTIPSRDSIDELLEMRRPIELLALLKSGEPVNDVLTFVLQHDELDKYTLEESVEAVYSANPGVQIEVQRNSEPQTYSKNGSIYELSGRPMNAEVIQDG